VAQQKRGLSNEELLSSHDLDRDGMVLSGEQE
jgi:hypothetical protein